MMMPLMIQLPSKQNLRIKQLLPKTPQLRLLQPRRLPQLKLQLPRPLHLKNKLLQLRRRQLPLRPQLLRPQQVRLPNLSRSCPGR